MSVTATGIGSGGGSRATIFEDLDAVADEDGLREKFGTIKSLGFFKGFSDGDIWELIRACTWQTYSPNESITSPRRYGALFLYHSLRGRDHRAGGLAW